MMMMSEKGKEKKVVMIVTSLFKKNRFEPQSSAARPFEQKYASCQISKLSKERACQRLRLKSTFFNRLMVIEHLSKIKMNICL